MNVNSFEFTLFFINPNSSPLPKYNCAKSKCAGLESFNKKSLLVTYSISIFSLPAFSFTSFSVLVGLVPFNVISLLE
jgi:hypothetical protein